MRNATLTLATGLLLTCVSLLSGANISTTGGITLYADGASGPPASVSNNLALATNGATPFALDELAGFGHLTVELNDGFYGNNNSWIGNGATSANAGGAFAGVDLGGSFNVNSISFGRDNTATFNDRALGTYTLQYRNDGSIADDTNWSTIGTVTYSGGVGPPNTQAAVRHQFNFAPVDATALRLVVPGTGLGGGTAIDEIEVYSGVPNPVGLTLSQTGPAGPANSVPDNLALASNGATAFAKDLIGGGAFPAHTIAGLNDGLYGNSNSWIGDTEGTFAGVDLGEMYIIDSIAFGRDNTGMFGDRAAGNITVQYTTVDDPDAFTPNSDWFTLDVLTYDGLFPASPALRHEYDLDTPVIATGIRLITADGGLAGGVAIDELEVFGRQVPEPASVAIWSLLGLVAAGVSWRRYRRCSP